MVYKPPDKILITSDDNIIQYVRTRNKKKDEGQAVYVYRFIKSITKENLEIEITHDFLQKQLTNFFKII